MTQAHALATICRTEDWSAWSGCEVVLSVGRAPNGAETIVISPNPQRTRLDPDDPESRVASLSPAIADSLRGCESQYCRGTWYVTVPACIYRQWPQPTPPAAHAQPVETPPVAWEQARTRHEEQHDVKIWKFFT